MPQTYRELVIQGNGSTVRSFVDWALKADAKHVIFSSDEHIRGERGLSAVAEFLKLKTPLVHLVATNALADRLLDGLKRSNADLELRADQPIQGAKFKFEYTLFTSDLAKGWNDRFRNPPEGVTIQGKIPEAIKTVEMSGVTVEVKEFNPIQSAHGVAVGQLLPVLDFYRECLAESLVHAGEIKLVYVD